jgi:hypothetical protein
MTNLPIFWYVEKLKGVRNSFYNELIKLNDIDLNRIISSGNNNYTVRWILYHLNQHESHYIGQINYLKRLQSLQ